MNECCRSYTSARPSTNRARDRSNQSQCPPSSRRSSSCQPNVAICCGRPRSKGAASPRPQQAGRLQHCRVGLRLRPRAPIPGQGTSLRGEMSLLAAQPRRIARGYAERHQGFKRNARKIGGSRRGRLGSNCGPRTRRSGRRVVESAKSQAAARDRAEPWCGGGGRSGVALDGAPRVPARVSCPGFEGGGARRSAAVDRRGSAR